MKSCFFYFRVQCFCKKILSISLFPAFTPAFSFFCSLDVQLYPPVCPPLICVSVPTVVPTSECFAVTVMPLHPRCVPRAECVLCAFLLVPASLWAVMCFKCPPCSGYEEKPVKKCEIIFFERNISLVGSWVFFCIVGFFNSTNTFLRELALM